MIKVFHVKKIMLLSVTLVVISCSKKREADVDVSSPVALQPVSKPINPAVPSVSAPLSIPSQGLTNTRSGGSRIVVVVGSMPITEADVEARVKLVLLTSGLQSNTQNIDNLRQQVLSALIDEKIQLQVAQPKDPSILDKAVKESFEGMAKDNNMSEAQLLEVLSKNNIPDYTMKDRLRAQIAWTEYIRSFYAGLTHITDAEVQEVLNKLQKNKDNTIYYVSEIDFVVQSPADDHKALQEANMVYNQLKAGADFKAMAQQFSRFSNKRGGDITQLVKGQMDPAAENALNTLTVGQVSVPIKTSTGYVIYQLRQRKHSGHLGLTDRVASLRQITLPVTAQTPPEEQQKFMPEINAYMTTKGCDAFDSLAARYGRKVDRLEKLSFNDISPEGRKQIEASLPGTTMQPSLSPDGLKVTMLCRVDNVEFKLPEWGEIKENLLQERLAQKSNRELMRNKGIIHIQYP